MSDTIPSHRIKLPVSNTLEAIAGCRILMLLSTEEHQDIVNSCQPLFTKNSAIARHLPIVVGQTDGITLRVYLVFPFMHARLHLCKVVLPLITIHGTGQEGVGIRVQIDALPLA